MNFKCPVCGNEVFEGEKFCHSCGSDIQNIEIGLNQDPQTVSSGGNAAGQYNSKGHGIIGNSVNQGNASNKINAVPTQKMPGGNTSINANKSAGNLISGGTGSSETLGIVSLACGILSLVLSVLGLIIIVLLAFAIILGIVGLVSSSIACNRGNWKYAKTGRTLSIIGICLPFVVIIITVSASCSLMGMMF